MIQSDKANNLCTGADCVQKSDYEIIIILRKCRSKVLHIGTGSP